jgi:hypothetical protein
MTGTDLYVNKPHKSRSYLNHLVYFVLIGYVVLWQHVLRVACVLCAVHNTNKEFTVTHTSLQ